MFDFCVRDVDVHVVAVTHRGHNVWLIHDAQHFEIRPACQVNGPTIRLRRIEAFGIIIIPCKSQCQLKFAIHRLTALLSEKLAGVWFQGHFW